MFAPVDLNMTNLTILISILASECVVKCGKSDLLLNQRSSVLEELLGGGE